jgi:hypothetical protein
MSETAKTKALEIVKALFSDETSAAELRIFAEEHDLNPKCRRDCEVCEEFSQLNFSYTNRDDKRYSVFELSFIGDAIVNHPNCDSSLSNEICEWVWSLGDAEWSRNIDAAKIANPNCSLEVLLEAGKETEYGFELYLIKNHPNLIESARQEILATRGWKKWPTNTYLVENTWVLNDADDLRAIQIN